MLAYILAITIALASLSLYFSAFFLPELHRKDDFLWSGVGLFYALILWVCAGRFTGAVLLGQAAAVTLLLSFGWQTIRLRRAIAHPEDKTDLRDVSVLNWLQSRLGGKQAKVTPKVPISQSPVAVTPEMTAIPDVEPVAIVDEATESLTVEFSEPETVVAETITFEETPMEEDLDIPETIPAEEPVRQPPSPPPAKKKFSFKSLFGLGKSQPTPPPTNLIDALDQTETETEDWEPQKLSTEAIDPLAVVSSEETSPTILEEMAIPVTDSKISSEVTETVEVYESDFDPFLADDEAETVIEQYQPKEQPKSEADVPTSPSEESKS